VLLQRGAARVLWPRDSRLAQGVFETLKALGQRQTTKCPFMSGCVFQIVAHFIGRSFCGKKSSRPRACQMRRSRGRSG
jgi:hypothetical protein